MNTFFKYFGAFCLLTIAASLAFCSMGVYNGMKTANRLLAGADNYTCRQFTYDLTTPDTDKFPAMVIAGAAYGMGPGVAEGQEKELDEVIEARQNELMEKGLEPAIRKVNELCKGNPDARVLNLFAHSLVSGTAPVVSSVSSTVTASPTLNTEH